MISIALTFSVLLLSMAVIKYPDQSNVKEKGLVWAQGLSQQEVGATGL